MGRLHLLSNHNCSTPYPLSGMLDRINPEIPYNSTQIAKPNIIVIIPDTPPYHIDMINNLWPTFWNEYIKIYKNKDNNCSYEIYLKAK